MSRRPESFCAVMISAQGFVAQRLADIVKLEGAAEFAVNGDRVGDVGDLNIVAATVEFHAAFHPADFRGAAEFVDFHQRPEHWWRAHHPSAWTASGRRSSRPP